MHDNWKIANLIRFKFGENNLSKINFLHKNYWLDSAEQDIRNMFVINPNMFGKKLQFLEAIFSYTLFT